MQNNHNIDEYTIKKQLLKPLFLHFEVEFVLVVRNLFYWLLLTVIFSRLFCCYDYFCCFIQKFFAVIFFLNYKKKSTYGKWTSNPSCLYVQKISYRHLITSSLYLLKVIKQKGYTHNPLALTRSFWIVYISYYMCLELRKEWIIAWQYLFISYILLSKNIYILKYTFVSFEWFILYRYANKDLLIIFYFRVKFLSHGCTSVSELSSVFIIIPV